MGIAERWKRSRQLPPDIAAALQGLGPLFQREGVVLAYLFGSLSRGQAGQDVDLAILTRDAPAFRLREKIAAALHTERIDLVDLRRAPPVLRFEILRTGRPLYVADEQAQERFELATLRLYRDTHPLRRRQREYLRRRMAP
jgi:predicted nucleotidyltransferase